MVRPWEGGKRGTSERKRRSDGYKREGGREGGKVWRTAMWRKEGDMDQNWEGRGRRGGIYIKRGGRIKDSDRGKGG